MMEDNTFLLNKEYLLFLYRLRQSAQKVLANPNSSKDKQELCECLRKLVMGGDHRLVNAGILETLKDSVSAVMMRLKEAQPNVSELQGLTLSSALFNQEGIDKFEKAKNALKKACISFEKEKLRAEKSLNTRKKIAGAEDSVEVKALKEEVRRYLGITRKLSDEDKKAALEILDKVDAFQVKVGKANMISVQFDRFTVSFSVSTKDCRNIYTQFKYSKFGGIESVLGEDKAKDFVETLAKCKRGKEFKTASGVNIAEEKKSKKVDEKKKSDSQNRIDEAQQNIKKAQENLVMVWHESILAIDPFFAYRDLISENSLLLSKSGADAEQIKDTLVENILREDNGLWEMFRGKEGTDNNGTSQYDKLFEKVVDNECKREMETLIESSYHTSQQSPATAVKMLEIQSKKLMQQHDLPAEFGTEYMLDRVYQFGMGMYTPQFDEDKFEFMNECFKSYGMAIRLSKKIINKRCSPNIKLNDVIHDKDSKVKKYKKQMTALLYDMGQKLAISSEAGKLVYDLELKERYLNICREYSGDPLRDRGTNESYWQDFVKNVDNQQKAKQTFDILNEEYGQEKARHNVLLLREGNPLAGDSLHHVVYAYYAPLWGDDPELLEARFNTRKNTVETLPTHPAFYDIHKDKEHKYNIGNGASVLVERNGSKRYVTVRTAQVGDVLLMPVLTVSDKNGKFMPLMQEDVLFITSSGRNVKEPKMSGCFARELSLINDGAGGGGNSRKE